MTSLGHHQLLWRFEEALAWAVGKPKRESHGRTPSVVDLLTPSTAGPKVNAERTHTRGGE